MELNNTTALKRGQVQFITGMENILEIVQKCNSVLCIYFNMYFHFGHTNMRSKILCYTIPWYVVSKVKGTMVIWDLIPDIKLLFFNWYSGGSGVQLGPLSTAATNRPIVPAPSDYDDGEIGGIGRGNRSTRRKPAPMLLCPPQTPHTERTRTQAAAVGSCLSYGTAWSNYLLKINM
jgi:hypothetical protein